MILGLAAIMMGSKNAKKLGKFYKKDVVGLKMSEEMVYGDDDSYLIGFELGNKVDLYISDHSKVKGQNVLPDRIMFNLEVDDIEKEIGRLKKKKVKVVANIYHVESCGFISTLEDLDGNYFQLVKTRE